jgi:hypothetical protein
MDLVLPNRVPEACAAAFLFPLDQKHDVDLERSSGEQLRDGTRGCQDGTFIIGHPASIQVPAPPDHGEGVRVPAFRRR